MDHSHPHDDHNKDTHARTSPLNKPALDKLASDPRGPGELVVGKPVSGKSVVGKPAVAKSPIGKTPAASQWPPGGGQQLHLQGESDLGGGDSLLDSQSFVRVTGQNSIPLTDKNENSQGGGRALLQVKSFTFGSTTGKPSREKGIGQGRELSDGAITTQGSGVYYPIIEPAFGAGDGRNEARGNRRRPSDGGAVTDQGQGTGGRYVVLEDEEASGNAAGGPPSHAGEERKGTAADPPYVDASDFQPLPGEPTPDPYAKVNAFFAGLEWEPIGSPILSSEMIHPFAADLHPFILRIYNQEMSSFSWLKLVWLEHLLERYSQALVMSQADLHPASVSSSSLSSSWFSTRVLADQRSIPLKTTWGLGKAFFMRGLLKGLSLGMFGSVEVVISSMTAYRMWRILSVGDTDFSEFKGIFDGSDEKGILSLAAILKLWPILLLELLAPALVFFSMLYGLWGTREAIGFTSQDIKQRADQIKAYVNQPSSWGRSFESFWIDGVFELVFGFRQAFAYSPSMEKLERSARWDGRRSADDIKEAFEPTLMVARQGRKLLRVKAFRSLMRQLHGVGLADMERLKAAESHPDVLQALVFVKATSLAELEKAAYDSEHYGEVDPNAWAITKKINALWVGLHAHYYLWQAGYATSLWARIFFPLFEATLWYLKIMTLIAIVRTIRTLILCPDKAVEIGFGYAIDADEFTLDCWYELLEQFRSVNISQPVSDLLQQMQNFNLVGLTSLSFYYMNLTGYEVGDIVNAAEERGAQITTLNWWQDISDQDMYTFAYNVLANSTFQAIWLGCTGEDDPMGGGMQLSDQGFQYLVNILSSMRKLTYFDICFPRITNAAAIALAQVLNSTLINRFYIEASAIGDTGGVVLAQALATMPIWRLMLNGVSIGDNTIRALAGVVQNSQELTELMVDGPLISNEGAVFFSQMINNSLLDTVGLESISVTDEGIVALTQAIIHIPLLWLTVRSHSGEIGISALSRQLPQTNTQVLWLEENVFTLDGMRALSNSFPFTNITELGLVGNYLYNETISSLASGIATSLISILAIYSNNLSNMMILLAPSLVNLQILSFVNCSLTDADIEILASYLPHYRQLTRLNIVNNPFGDQGAIALAQVLAITGITYLDLSQNNITNVGARALAGVYPSTPLETLLLKYNDEISDDYLYEIESYRLEGYCQSKICRNDIEWYSGGTQSQMNPSTMVGFLGVSHSGYASSYGNNSRIAGPSSFTIAETATQDITPAIAGSLIIGVTVLGVLIYKNTSLIQTAVKKTWQYGFQLWQWSKGKPATSPKLDRAACSLFGNEPIPVRAEIEVKSSSSPLIGGALH